MLAVSRIESRKEALKVLMFTDQVGSTQQNRARPLNQMGRVKAAQREMTDDCVRRCRGTVLKDTGDGHMIEFPSPSLAVVCGHLLQQAVSQHDNTQSDDRMKFELHIGIDVGTVLLKDDGDAHGPTADTAARICQACPAGAVYFTEKVMREMHHEEVEAAEVHLELKGFDTPMKAYRLVKWTGDVPTTTVAKAKTGTQLGTFEISGLLGKGGMGEVYRARDTRLKREVAIKTLPAEFSEDLSRAARFQREAEVLASLNHPNIASLYDLQEANGLPFLVMELVPGETLADRIARGPIPLEETLNILKQVCDALEAAHEKSIVHRDLKPANVKVLPDGKVKVLDFGLAKEFQTLPTTNSSDLETFESMQTAVSTPGLILGTAPYMSPEQAKGQEVDQRSDIFALGCIGFEMLSGRRAFGGEGATEILAHVLTTEPNWSLLPASVPAHVRDLLKSCVEKIAKNRRQNAHDLRLEIERATAAPAPAQTGAETPSIAVLPFSNLSADKENEYFSDGLAEEILNALTQLPALRVIARASAFAFRGREHAFDEIREKLKVESILQGSVRRAGNRLRVTAQLINVADESQLWSERYDREMTDVFAIQDDVAHAIVEKLKVQLGGRSSEPLVKRYTENPEAHSLFLKGLFYANRYGPGDMAKAYDYLHQAVAREPHNARAWVQLAEYHIHIHFNGPPSAEMPQALEAARRAIDADSSLGAAHAAQALVKAFYEHRWTEALQQIEAAADLPPTTWYYIWGGNVLWSNGRFDEAERSLRKALDNDPLAFVAHYLLSLFYNDRGLYDLALTHANQAMEFSPNPGAMSILGATLSNLGRHDEGIALLEKAGQSQLRFLGHLGVAYVRAGRRGDADRLLADLEETRRQKYVSACAISRCALALGKTERALDWLNTAAEDHDFELGFMPGNPHIETLRSHPRFMEIMKRVNLPTFS
jgi:eukaryotic-like serine/threonine-protein kinase